MSTPSKEATAEKLYNDLGMMGRSDFKYDHAINIIQSAFEEATNRGALIFQRTGLQIA